VSGPVYSYRPSKAVTRRMVVDMLARLGPVAPPAGYHYIGLGALEFIDFELVHRRLGITTMTSIEQDIQHFDRYKSNRPHNNITLLGGKAIDQLSNVNWSVFNAVWLDYECPLDTNEVLPTIRYLAGKLNDGDFLAVTMNAEPGALKGRLDRFKKNVGDVLVPANTDDDTLGEWGWAARQQQILFNVLRNELRRDGRNRSWNQLLNIHYSDQARMQTVAGVIGTPALAQTLSGCRFGDLDFYRPDKEALVIQVPYLTPKERRALNEKLPRKSGKALRLPGVDPGKVEAYVKLYRWLEPTGS